MATILKKCLLPESVILQYQLSFTPDDDKILGVTGRYMYIELDGYLKIPDADNNIDDVVRGGETEDKTAVLRITIREFQRLFKIWILGKKSICESYGHWCGVFGNFHIEEFKVVGYSYLTRFDETKDCDDLDFVYSEEIPIIQVIRWNEQPDFEHG